MSARVFWWSAARRSLCCLSRRTSVRYSQSIAARVQGSEVSIPASTSAETLTGPSSDSLCAVADSRNPTRLDRYLASIGAAKLEPTLDVIEQCRPEGFSRPDSSRYGAEYSNLLEMLCRSFSKDQLRRFTELYKLDPIWTRASRRKTEYAESIIEKAWGWPSLKEIERKQRDMSEVLVKSFTVTPSQLFLIMGRDGADLLQLSTQYNVHISLTSSPLALRVEGLRGSLKGLTEYISFLKKGIVDEIFELPTGRPVRSDLLQRISRLAGAYVENHGHRGKIRICAKHPNDIIAAKRLALRASLEVGVQARTVCFDPPSNIRDTPIETSEPHRYFMYPFVAPSSFPWTMHSGGAFRLRRVADWLGINSYEDIASTGGLADNPHRLLNLNQSGFELSQLVSPATSVCTSHRQKIVTASFGHVLVSSGDGSQRTAIFPPLRGASCLPDILKWVETSGTPLTFVPSVPPVTMTVAAGKRRNLLRLIYRTLSQLADRVSNLPHHVLKFEMELPSLFSTSAQATQDPESAPKPMDVSSFDGSSSGAKPPGVLNNEWDLNCQVGMETYVNLMLPDRPMDTQLCIFEWDDVASTQQPQVLREYAEQFRHSLTDKAHLSQPDPPSTLSHEGRIYYLHNSLSLRESKNNLNLLSAVSGDCSADSLAEVSRESIVDLQSTQKMELCQVKFDDNTDGPSWKHFLATCDQLSILSLRSRSKDKS